MNNLVHLWFKLLKKLRGKSIRNSTLDQTSKIEAGSEFNNSSMARFSYCGYNCTINNTDIGAFCSLSNNVIIGGGTHPIHWVSTSPVFYAGRDSIARKFATHHRENPLRTRIGNDVWIGRNVMIKQGVHIGDGAVIGMGSIVTKDVESYSIVGGNPARLIRYRFGPETRAHLEKIAWWDFTDAEIQRHASSFNSVESFLNQFSHLK